MISVDSIIASVTQMPVIGIYMMPMVASMFPGIPEELFLLAIGFLTNTGVIQFWFAWIVFLFGFLLVDTILFAITREGTYLLKKFKQRLAKMGIVDNQEAILRNAKTIIFVSRFLLFVRWIGPVLTGVARLSYKKFLIYDFLALIIYVPFVLLLGRFFHSRVSKIIEGINVFGSYATALIVIIIIILIATLGRKTFLRFIKKTLAKKEGNGNSFLKKLGIVKISKEENE